MTHPTTRLGAPDPPRVRVLSCLFAVSLVAGVTSATVSRTAHAAPKAEPFKVANIHIETNASGCDMGIQIRFDTDGITQGSVSDPAGRRIYALESTGSMRKTGGQTEGFLEGIEPQITELVSALGCAPSEEEGTASLDELFAAFPAGDYTFKGQSKGGVKFKDQATLSHAIPAGPEITAPAAGAVVPDAPLLLDWNAVTEPILPQLGPVHVAGYHVTVEEGGGESPPTLDVDLAAADTSLTVPAEFLHPSQAYKFEVLATDESGNQTITEGFFCTVGVAQCEEPE